MNKSNYELRHELYNYELLLLFNRFVLFIVKPLDDKLFLRVFKNRVGRTDFTKERK